MLWSMLSGSATVLRRRLAVDRVCLTPSGQGKDLSGGRTMNVTVTLNSREDYFSWGRAVLRRHGGVGVVVISSEVGVRWYCRETGSGEPEVMAMQVNKTMLIGPEVSQPQCCKKGGYLSWPSPSVVSTCLCVVCLASFASHGPVVNLSLRHPHPECCKWFTVAALKAEVRILGALPCPVVVGVGGPGFELYMRILDDRALDIAGASTEPKTICKHCDSKEANEGIGLMGGTLGVESKLGVYSKKTRQGTSSISFASFSQADRHGVSLL
ncbi:hypothetical protein E2C01_039359 [Portunus trituberculatus]|uniref:Uncharacterized protein n=1 Tax=Portunus trituberculatus TaxID=210409 RepID=A0A5B7FKH9_PORTR|nr:hypothetical protein [Portunus trituberculatus]